MISNVEVAKIFYQKIDNNINLLNNTYIPMYKCSTKIVTFVMIYIFK